MYELRVDRIKEIIGNLNGLRRTIDSHFERVFDCEWEYAKTLPELDMGETTRRHKDHVIVLLDSTVLGYSEGETRWIWSRPKVEGRR